MSCPHPDMASMDYWRGSVFSDTWERWENRCCMKCLAHWHGPEGGEIKEYTRAEWDEYVNGVKVDA